MKRIAAWVLLVGLSLSGSMAAQKENRGIGENQREARKASKQYQKYQKKQARRQRKAAKKAQKQQRRVATRHQHH
jgi:hypothetical protein